MKVLVTLTESNKISLITGAMKNGGLNPFLSNEILTKIYVNSIFTLITKLFIIFKFSTLLHAIDNQSFTLSM